MANLCSATIGSISVLIKKQNLKPVKTGRNSAKYYDAGVLKRLRLHYARSKPKRNKTNNTQGLGTQLAIVRSENQLLRDQFESTKSTIEVSRNELKIRNSQTDKLQDLTNRAQQLDLAIHIQHQESLKRRSQPTDEPAKHKRGILNWFQKLL